MASDEELEKQAEAMAAKALPASLPDAVRAAKLPAVKKKILERLKAQRVEQASKAEAIVPTKFPTAAPPPPGSVAQAIGGAGFMPAGAPPPPPPGGSSQKASKVDGVEMCGDEAWFADAEVRQRLRDFVAEAHKEQKILVAQPAEEVERICPSDGRVLGAGAVLRLGGAHLGGYGESDIAYAYRQLSRALHPDKNPDIPKAPAAFHRLSEASDELRQGLNEQRTMLQQLVGVMGGQASQEMLSRPQEALFAEACRLLVAVCGCAGEGEVSAAAAGRIMSAFGRANTFYTCMPQVLLAEWFEKNHMLEMYASTNFRTVYDCAPKRFRAQFLCLLNRTLTVEAKRCNGCVRGGWSQIMQTFPELGIWREFREMVQHRVWDCSRDPPEVPKKEPSPSRKRERERERDRERDRDRRDRDRSRSGRRRRDGGGGSLDPQGKEKDMQWDARWKSSDDNRGQVEVKPDWETTREAKKLCRQKIESNVTTGAKASRWARKWRAAMVSVLPSGQASTDSATVFDKEVRKLGAALWKDVTRWAEQCQAHRGLSLFRADHQSSKTFGWDGKASEEAAPVSRGLEPGSPPAEWAFLPLADLLLVVGDCLVGHTAEGFFADSPAGHKRKTLAQCYKKRDDKKQNEKQSERSKENRDNRSGNQGDNCRDYRYDSRNKDTSDGRARAHSHSKWDA